MQWGFRKKPQVRWPSLSRLRFTQGPGAAGFPDNISTKNSWSDMDESLKLGAATDYLERRLGDTVYWECSSDLLEILLLYLPDEQGDYEDIKVPLGEIGLVGGKLDPVSEGKLETLLKKRSL